MRNADWPVSTTSPAAVSTHLHNDCEQNAMKLVIDPAGASRFFRSAWCAPSLAIRRGEARNDHASRSPHTSRPPARRLCALQESAAIRCNYPETYAYLKAKRDRHPVEDALEDYTQWTVMGEPLYPKITPIPKPGQPKPVEASSAIKKEETEEEYIRRRCEEFMHKSLSSRRGPGGKMFTIGGGGDAGVAYQVI